jgi:hypothetical protein
MTTTVPLAEFSAWLAGEVDASPEMTAVLAGHFAIFSAGGHAVELLDDAPPAPGGAAAMVEFTRCTWDTACQVAAGAARPFRLVALVDDIQFVRPVNRDRGTAERLGAALAAEYLERNPRLPDYHASGLAVHGLDDARVLRNADHQWLFSERQLRIGAVRRIRDRVAAPDRALATVRTEDGGSTITVSIPEYGEHRLVQSGHTSCAGGYLELLMTLHERGVRKLVALIPMRCLGQVTLGTTLARHLFGPSELATVSVGIPENAGSGGLVVARDP